MFLSSKYRMQILFKKLSIVASEQRCLITFVQSRKLASSLLKLLRISTGERHGALKCNFHDTLLLPSGDYTLPIVPSRR